MPEQSANYLTRRQTQCHLCGKDLVGRVSGVSRYHADCWIKSMDNEPKYSGAPIEPQKRSAYK